MTETFPIVPGEMRVAGVLVALFIVLLATAGVLWYSFSGARMARFEISPAGLRLRGDFYGRLIPVAHLHADSARAINLNTERALQPVVRTLGSAIPGYRAGWFRLRDGEKALLYVTDPTRVVYVPTSEGYAVLLSVADPTAFIVAIRQIAR